MDVFRLAQRLRDPDPRVRVEALRILAMVEETRALEAVAWVYKNDPEPGVRDVANWAGRIIFAARQRGHSTQKAVEDMFAEPLSPEREELFLEGLEFGLSEPKKDGHRAVRRFLAEQTYQRRLTDAMRLPGPASQDDAVPGLPPPKSSDVPPVAPLSSTGDLLDAGLTDLFAE